MAHVLGVDVDDGSYACHAPWRFEVAQKLPFDVHLPAPVTSRHARLTAPDVTVLAEADGIPQMTLRRYGRGSAAWLSGFEYSAASANMLLELLLHLTGARREDAGACDHPLVEAAWFPASGTLVLMNNGDAPVRTEAALPGKRIPVALEAGEMKFIEV
jgi:hypothetical protein